MKAELFFLVALPRSGNTLFASIMNQNPNVACTANSITLEIIKDLHLLKNSDVFQNYPDHKSLDNVLESVFDNYYKDWPQKYIIDRGPAMTPDNLMAIKNYYKKPFKVIVLWRNLMDVLASYMQWYTENPDAFPNRFGHKTDFDKLMMLMNDQGAIAKQLKAIKNAMKPENKDMCYFIKYNEFVLDPENHLKSLYKFLGMEYYPHYFENLKQIDINGIQYDDKIVGSNMHKVRPGKIRQIYNPYIEKLPKEIKEKYGHIIL
tara:strand:+ start:3265 stop:4047 length:783 start_codon:yes stop_codon:yes gene_type:complete